MFVMLVAAEKNIGTQSRHIDPAWLPCFGSLLIDLPQLPCFVSTAATSTLVELNVFEQIYLEQSMMLHQPCLF